MLTHTDLKKGVKIILQGEPYEILEAQPLKKAQRRVVLQTKIRNLITGNVFSRNFHQGDSVKEVNLSKVVAKFLFLKEERKQGSAKDRFLIPPRNQGSANEVSRFLYSHPDRRSLVSDGASRNLYFFCEKDNPAKRFDLTKTQIGPQAQFLKPNQIVEAIIFENKVINISLPIKIQLKVTESPPGVKGGRSQPGTKTVTLETGVKINVPLFVKEGDLIEINTETGEYVRRIKLPEE